MSRIGAELAQADGPVRGVHLRRFDGQVATALAVADAAHAERNLAAVICSAGFASDVIDQYRLCSPFLPANTQIAGTAIA